jgi:hypothetical protein
MALPPAHTSSTEQRQKAHTDSGILVILAVQQWLTATPLVLPNGIDASIGRGDWMNRFVQNASAERPQVNAQRKTTGAERKDVSVES